MMDDTTWESSMWPGGYQAHTCGYCKSKGRGSKNFYAGSDTQAVHPAHYQGLMQRGWRRSGTVWYKGDVKNACCPHYSTRVDATKFTPHKDQRRAVNQFTRYVLGPEYVRKAAGLCPKSREETRRRKTVFDTCQAIHEPEYGQLPRPIDRKTKKPIEPAHRLDVTLEPDDFTTEKYKLFADYQREIHHEPPPRISERGFRSFLCSGMAQSSISVNGRQRKIGSYHQCYRLDGKLVALGVLDLLPQGVSSVYLIYDPTMGQWEFGKLSALREIALAIEEGYEYYYMGYYIHSCAKMRYKRSFAPTYVLDPETYAWDLFDNGVARRMDARKYVSLSRERALGIPEPPVSADAAGGPAPPTMTDPSTSVDAVPVDDGPDNDAEEDPSILGRLFTAGMPGVMSKAEVQEQVALSDVRVRVRGAVYGLGHLEWDLERRDILLAVAEFVACVGPELATQIVIELD